MREFSVPPVVTIGDRATLTDPVWDNAAAAPDAAQFARRTAEGWREVSCADFRDQVVALARGLMARPRKSATVLTRSCRRAGRRWAIPAAGRCR